MKKVISTVALCAFAFANGVYAAGLAPESFNRMYSLAKSGDVYSLREAVHRGLNIDSPNQNGNTGLCVAIYRGDQRAYNSFRAAGANPRHPCTSVIPVAQYNSFMNSGAVVATNQVPAMTYTPLRTGFLYSPRFWTYAGLGAVAVAALALSGGGGGGGKSTPAPKPMVDKSLAKVAGSFVVTNRTDEKGEKLPDDNLITTTVSGKDSVTYTISSDDGFSYKEEYADYFTQKNNYRANYQPLLQADKFLVSYKMIDGIRVATNGQPLGIVSLGEIGMALYGWTADGVVTKYASPSSIEIQASNAAYGIVASNLAEAVLQNPGVMTMEASGGNYFNVITGMYADSGAKITNEGTIDATASNNGTAVGMMTMQILDHHLTEKPAEYGEVVTFADNQGTINMQGDNIVAMGGYMSKDVSGYRSAFDPALLVNNKKINIVSTGTAANLIENVKTTGVNGFRGAMGMRADAVTTATNTGQISITSTAASEVGGNAAGMVVVHGGTIINGDSTYGAKYDNTGGTTAGFYRGVIVVGGKDGVLKPTISDQFHIEEDAIVSDTAGYGMVSLRGGILNSSNILNKLINYGRIYVLAAGSDAIFVNMYSNITMGDKSYIYLTGGRQSVIHNGDTQIALGDTTLGDRIETKGTIIILNEPEDEEEQIHATLTQDDESYVFKGLFGDVYNYADITLGSSVISDVRSEAIHLYQYEGQSDTESTFKGTVHNLGNIDWFSKLAAHDGNAQKGYNLPYLLNGINYIQGEISDTITAGSLNIPHLLEYVYTATDEGGQTVTDYLPIESIIHINGNKLPADEAKKYYAVGKIYYVNDDSRYTINTSGDDDNPVYGYNYGGHPILLDTSNLDSLKIYNTDLTLHQISTNTAQADIDISQRADKDYIISAIKATNVDEISVDSGNIDVVDNSPNWNKGSVDTTQYHFISGIYAENTQRITNAANINISGQKSLTDTTSITKGLGIFSTDNTKNFELFNSGNINSWAGILIKDSKDVFVENTGSIYARSNGIYVSSAKGIVNIENNKIIDASAKDSTAIYVQNAKDKVNIINNDTITTLSGETEETKNTGSVGIHTKSSVGDVSIINMGTIDARRRAVWSEDNSSNVTIYNGYSVDSEGVETINENARMSSLDDNTVYVSRGDSFTNLINYGTISGEKQKTVRLSGSANIINHKEIINTDAYRAISFDGSNKNITLNNSGNIISEKQNAIGVSNANTSVSITNTGTIKGATKGIVFDNIAGSNITINNSEGEIISTSYKTTIDLQKANASSVVNIINGNADAICNDKNDTDNCAKIVVNNDSGTTLTGGEAIKANSFKGQMTIDNYGLIDASDIIYSYAISINEKSNEYEGANNPVSLNNYGIIKGRINIKTDSGKITLNNQEGIIPNSVILSANNGDVTIQNSGSIQGINVQRSLSETVTNSGTIQNIHTQSTRELKITNGIKDTDENYKICVTGNEEGCEAYITNITNDSNVYAYNVVNYGLINTIYSPAQSGIITNYGRIYGDMDNYAVYHSGKESFELTNYGNITGDKYAIYVHPYDDDGSSITVNIDNLGTIKSGSHAMIFEGHGIINICNGGKCADGIYETIYPTSTVTGAIITANSNSKQGGVIYSYITGEDGRNQGKYRIYNVAGNTIEGGGFAINLAGNGFDDNQGKLGFEANTDGTLPDNAKTINTAWVSNKGTITSHCTDGEKCTPQSDIYQTDAIRIIGGDGYRIHDGSGNKRTVYVYNVGTIEAAYGKTGDNNISGSAVKVYGQYLGITNETEESGDSKIVGVLYGRTGIWADNYGLSGGRITIYQEGYIGTPAKNSDGTTYNDGVAKHVSVGIFERSVDNSSISIGNSGKNLPGYIYADNYGIQTNGGGIYINHGGIGSADERPAYGIYNASGWYNSTVDALMYEDEYTYYDSIAGSTIQLCGGYGTKGEGECNYADYHDTFIYGTNAAIYSTSNPTIINDGIIDGGNYGIRVSNQGAGTTSITNYKHGVILGGSGTETAAIKVSHNTGAGGDIDIENSGKIKGGDDSIDLATAEDKKITVNNNSGGIIGYITDDKGKKSYSNVGLYFPKDRMGMLGNDGNISIKNNGIIEVKRIPILVEKSGTVSINNFGEGEITSIEGNKAISVSAGDDLIAAETDVSIANGGTISGAKTNIAPEGQTPVYTYDPAISVSNASGWVKFTNAEPIEEGINGGVVNGSITLKNSNASESESDVVLFNTGGEINGDIDLYSKSGNVKLANGYIEGDRRKPDKQLPCDSTNCEYTSKIKGNITLGTSTNELGATLTLKNSPYTEDTENTEDKGGIIDGYISIFVDNSHSLANSIDIYNDGKITQNSDSSKATISIGSGGITSIFNESGGLISGYYNSTAGTYGTAIDISNVTGPISLSNEGTINGEIKIDGSEINTFIEDESSSTSAKIDIEDSPTSGNVITISGKMYVYDYDKDDPIEAAVHINGNTNLTVNYDGNTNLTVKYDSGYTITVDGDNNRAFFAFNTNVINNGTIKLVSYSSETSNVRGLSLDQSGTITNNGTISVGEKALSSYAMWAVDGAQAKNGVGGTISVAGTNSYGMYASPWNSSTPSSAYNDGTISLFSTAAGSYGMYAKGYNSIAANYGDISISGDNDGINAKAMGADSTAKAVNYGTITVIDHSNHLDDDYDKYIELGKTSYGMYATNSGTIINIGDIVVGDADNPKGHYAIGMYADGVNSEAINYGSIYVKSDGIAMLSMNRASLTNYGYIEITYSNDGNHGYAFSKLSYISDGSRITNSGVINIAHSGGGARFAQSLQGDPVYFDSSYNYGTIYSASTPGSNVPNNKYIHNAATDEQIKDARVTGLIRAYLLGASTLDKAVIKQKICELGYDDPNFCKTSLSASPRMLTTLSAGQTLNLSSVAPLNATSEDTSDNSVDTSAVLEEDTASTDNDEPVVSLTKSSAKAFSLGNGGSFINNGLVISDEDIDFEDWKNDDTATVQVSSDGVFSANSLKGTVVANSDIVVSDTNEREYETENTFVGDTSDLNVLSGSYMFTASLKRSLGNTAGIVMSMREFDDVKEAKGVADFLNDNYDNGNRVQMFNRIKSAKDRDLYEKAVNEELGLDFIPTLAKQNMEFVRDTGGQMTDAVFENLRAENRQQFITGVDYYHHRNSSYKGIMSYDSDGLNVYGIYNEDLNSDITAGLGLSVGTNHSEYDDDSTSRQATAQLYIPVTFTAKDFALISMPKFGVGTGEYKRRVADDSAHKADLTTYYYGISNQARKKFEFSGIDIEPTAEFNILGMYMDKIKERNNMYVKSQNDVSVEGGLGLYIGKTVEFANSAVFKLRFGGTYYRELADPYRNMRAGFADADGSYEIKGYNAKRDRAVISLRADYQFKLFDLYIKASEYLESNSNFAIQAGMKYNFK